RDLRAYAKPALAAAVGAGLVVWAVYRFHVAIAHGFVPVPAPELLAGLRQLATHNESGHPAFLLGHVSRYGWWYYAPVVIAVKTPLAFLALAALAIGFTARELRGRADWRSLAPLLGALAVLLTAMWAAIDIGVRHVLPVYPLLAISAASAVHALWRDATGARRVATRTALAALVLLQGSGAVRAYPDFLADFNALAGRHPERIAVDSNLDWGQDLRRLADTLAARHVTSVSLFYFGSTPVGAFRVADTVRVGGAAHPTGWVAVSRTYLAGVYADCYTWLAHETLAAHIGRSIELYRILPDTARRLPEGTFPIRSSAEPYGAVLGTPVGNAAICHEPRALIAGGTTALTDDDPADGDESGRGPSAPSRPASGGDSSLARGPALHVTDQMLLAAAENPSDWITYGRDYTNRRYVPFTQIDRDNVRHLQLAWVHQLETPPGGQETAPIEVDGTIFYTGPLGYVVAVDAATGVERWRHQHKLGVVPTCCGAVNRGVAVYHDKVYLSTLDAHLLALDARTGRVVWDVEVVDPSTGYSMTSAPLAVGGKIIVGVSGSEFAIRGFVDAYDAETGAHLWRFWTIPSPAEGGWWGEWRTTTPDG
ncbi:MAG: PQQ-binding-like beta-propeller repeat protein, partial [Gemmatimonadaceae bacterium]|nr:PQQ-binding-like beta-propeller repeat protein [Gemmatimonadaceae bacterium]